MRGHQPETLAGSSDVLDVAVACLATALAAFALGPIAFSIPVLPVLALIAMPLLVSAVRGNTSAFRRWPLRLGANALVLAFAAGIVLVVWILVGINLLVSAAIAGLTVVLMIFGGLRDGAAAGVPSRRRRIWLMRAASVALCGLGTVVVVVAMVAPPDPHGTMNITSWFVEAGIPVALLYGFVSAAMGSSMDGRTESVGGRVEQALQPDASRSVH